MINTVPKMIDLPASTLLELEGAVLELLKDQTVITSGKDPSEAAFKMAAKLLALKAYRQASGEAALRKK
jgi:hypothetical protein